MQEYFKEAAPIAPPVAVTGLNLFNIPLQEWVYVVTIAYTLALIVQTTLKIYDRFKNGRK